MGFRSQHLPWAPGRCLSVGIGGSTAGPAGEPTRAPASLACPGQDEVLATAWTCLDPPGPLAGDAEPGPAELGARGARGRILHASKGMPGKAAQPWSGMGIQRPPTHVPWRQKEGENAEGVKMAEKAPTGSPIPLKHPPMQSYHTAPFAAFCLKMYIQALNVQIFTTVYKCTKPDRM